jgi:hypothetical protein
MAKASLFCRTNAQGGSGQVILPSGMNSAADASCMNPLAVTLATSASQQAEIDLMNLRYFEYENFMGKLLE